MRLLISRSPMTMSYLARGALGPYLGHLLSPHDPTDRTVLRTGLPYAAMPEGRRRDGKEPLRSLLAFIHELPTRPLFITPPCFQEDAILVRARFETWRDELVAYGPVGFVASRGAEAELLPWAQLDALVLDGSQQWLRSRPTRDLGRAAKLRRKHLHVCNLIDLAGVDYAHNLEADSVSLAPHVGLKASNIAPFALAVQIRSLGPTGGQAQPWPPPTAAQTPDPRD